MWETSFFEKAKSPPSADKHELLLGAFDAWLERTRGTAGRRLVLDGFAGAGRFGAGPRQRPAASDAALGSPLLLLQRARRRLDAGPWQLVLAEKSAVNFARLRAAVASELGRAEAGLHELEGLTVELHHDTFEHTARALLAGPPSPGGLLAFVDPYGCDGLSFATLAGLAARGDLLVHLATRAIYTKLVTVSGDSPRQERRMDALLGGAVPWRALRAEARTLDPAAARRRVAEVLIRGLEREQPGVRAVVHPLRGEDACLVHTCGRA